MANRELDTRKTAIQRAAIAPVANVALPRINALTSSPVSVHANTAALGVIPPAGQQSHLDIALSFVSTHRANLGFAGNDVAEFVPDAVVQRTSAGSAVVHLHQRYRGLPVFQMSRTVRFNPQSQIVDATGDTASMPEGLNIVPNLSVNDAVLKAAQHLASTGGTYSNQFKESFQLPGVDLTDFHPEVVCGFPLPSQPTVLDKGPFENLIPAYLMLFVQPAGPRLAWHIVITFCDYADQYVVIVSADEKAGEILYCKSTIHRVHARGNVFEFSPGVASRRMIDFPRPLGDFPAVPTVPLVGFPGDWIDADKTIGNSARATLNLGATTLTGVLQGGGMVFDPADPNGDDQKLLNIFYFCNYMHDFLYILGFDEATGNFQLVNFTHQGLGNDPVRARAHSGAVTGTANMSTAPDGQPPLMNMGLVVSTSRHTAFDADVVFHEFTHGLTNRLVGGPANTSALDKLQSSGMGEGWSDFFALTIQNFSRTHEKFVLGDWVVNNPAGLRSAPYDDNYPVKYGGLSNLPIDPDTGTPDEHDIGEVWCAALLMMTRRIRLALGDNQAGYRLAWSMVVDGLKLTHANPTFLDARDAILHALDDLKLSGRIPIATHKAARKASWEAFAHFGMGANAFSDDADSVDGITPDSAVPTDL